jgi:outer membrane protein OmpA-like peptidoglycan-associated protein
MNHPRRFGILIAMLASGLVWACGAQRVRTPAPRGQDLIVLLPDPVDGTIGRAGVSNPAGGVELAAARESTSVSPHRPPGPVIVMSEAAVQRLFGDALAALPPAPQHVVLYFRFESDQLTEQSRALVPQILQAVKDRPFPDVAVVGHTDTTGTAASNIELGLRRARAIRNLLLDAGVVAGVIETTSHGEADLLVKTADEVPEPRNRRVDITVR